MRRKDSRIERQFTHAAAVQRERRLLYRDAYGLTGLYGKTFDNFESLRWQRNLNRQARSTWQTKARHTMR